MKKSDFIFVFGVIVFFAPFFLFDAVYNGYMGFNKEHGIIMSFIKFAILATLGEVIALRMRKGVYNHAEFGILPRAVIWGFLGIAIAFAFKVFAAGTPEFLVYLGFPDAKSALQNNFSALKLFVAFSISASMNLIFAPIMMTFHKITDRHISDHHGKISSLFTPVRFGYYLATLDWSGQWHFIFKKTIPFFWIPAHTVTFMLPEEFRVLFAAVLGIALGILLAFANLKPINGNNK